MNNSTAYISSIIDHTILGAEVTEEDLRKKCAEAKKYNFASVCSNPNQVALMAAELADTEVKVCTVIGFPLGVNLTEIKVAEAKAAIRQGADELDMVLNIGALKKGEFNLVKEDIKAVVEAAGDKLVKVIIETCYLTDIEKVTACELAKEAGADFVKTSTGFGSGGATASDIKLMRSAVGLKMGVKASGGIHSFEDAQTMIKAGATRIGASAGVQIVNEK